MRSTPVISGALAAALSVMSLGAAAQTTLTLSTPDPESSSITRAGNHFAELVEEKTNGSIDVRVFPNGTLYGGDPPAGVNQLGSGSLDMLLLSSSLYASFNPKFTAISVPYLFDDTEQIVNYLDSDLGGELLGDLERLDIVGIDMWPRPFRQITNSVREIQEPSDMEGLKFRVPNNPLWVEFFEATGAAPTPMAFSEVYNALQVGVIDGQENPVNIPVAAKFYEVQDYITLSNHMADAWVLGVNQGRWSGLSEEQRTAIREAANETLQWKLEFDAAEHDEALATLRENGMEVYELTDEQQQMFVDVAAPLYPTFAELVEDEAFFERTLEFVGKD
ncbi:DctP family TRAP transporter solute-binding subunit [Sediminicurvatus halobius]|uniref:ABC transporter substrate-binding protein n=1 Tax=Sediminicurvatus halobius TaxID=2182432 RepID=A0A2U2MXG0_9GAMM|nr:DctP family TRAP transporter solute-binding subunit [Spiribacter halobius]PWG61496.1 ABC transporter substrate-binding protein [Spiribacter halobius]UEX77965.1 DctP family TRAP transporter solute-binding subunit [Spiribacter halobius]